EPESRVVRVEPRGAHDELRRPQPDRPPPAPALPQVDVERLLPNPARLIAPVVWLEVGHPPPHAGGRLCEPRHVGPSADSHADSPFPVPTTAPCRRWSGLDVFISMRWCR